VRSLKAILENWEKYKSIRGMMEDIFKLAKNAFSLLTQRRNYRRLPNGSWWRGLNDVYATNNYSTRSPFGNILCKK